MGRVPGQHLRLNEEDGLLVVLAYSGCHVLVQRANLERLIPKGLVQHVVAQDGRVVGKPLCVAVPQSLRSW